MHIKFDTGMGRLGIRIDEYSLLKDALSASGAGLHVTGLYTHFPVADELSNHATALQLRKFHDICDEYMRDFNVSRNNITLHAANSYATMYHPGTHLDMVRPGILFYGYYQTLNDKITLGSKFDFKPGLSLVARPISRRIMKKNEHISYGSKYQVTDDELMVGVMPLGYADGISRQLSNKGVKFSGHELLGTVTMDQVVLSNVKNDDYIEIIGKSSPSLEEWAELSGTVTYEILTHLGARLRRELV